MRHHAVRASGAVGIVAGVLTILANAPHPPRTFEGFGRAVLNPAWEPVHALGQASPSGRWHGSPLERRRETHRWATKTE